MVCTRAAVRASLLWTPANARRSTGPGEGGTSVRIFLLIVPIAAVLAALAVWTVLSLSLFFSGGRRSTGTLAARITAVIAASIAAGGVRTIARIFGGALAASLAIATVLAGGIAHSLSRA